MKVASVLFALVCLVAALGKESSPPVKVEEKVFVLEPLKIRESPLISYAIDIAIYADPKTKKVMRIFIERVIPDSDAERAGLQKGDEIVKVDGLNVKELDAAVSAESPLGQKFLKRTPGESLKLEVLTRRAQQVTLRAQREMPGMHFP